MSIQLEVRLRPGAEEAARRQLLGLGASVVEQRGPGVLRVLHGGPLRLLTGFEGASSLFAVRAMPGLDPARLDETALLDAAMELAAVVTTARKRRDLKTYKLASDPRLPIDPKAMARVWGRLGSRLDLRPAAQQPDLEFLLRPMDGGVELALRLPSGS